MPNRYQASRAKSAKSYTMQRGGAMLGDGGDNAFNSVEMKRPEGSWFDQTHSHTTTGNMGALMPLMCKEQYPGDKVRINSELLVRLQPMIGVPMHRFDATVHHVFIPTRILWPLDQYEKFLKGEAVTVPYLDFGSGLTQGLPNYMGVPELTGANTLRVQATPFAAYQRVFYEMYRDQNLSSMTDNDKPYCLMGDNLAQFGMLTALRKRSYQHDYFTSALPFTQKGTEATINFDFVDTQILMNKVPGAADSDHWNVQPQLVGVPVGAPVDLGIAYEVSADAVIGLYAKTSALSGTSFTVNDFRLALATQHWLERMAIGGTRATEILRAHFGVSTSDQRLDRPEYIGGMKTPIVLSEVLQTSETTVETPQGNMSGHGIAAGYGGEEETYTVEEHGWILSIVSILPKAIYGGQGLSRSLDWNSRNKRDEWYWPEFANLGEQAIKVQEIFADLNTAGQQEDWGYTARFNELRYMPNRISGRIQDNLAFWTAARIFTTVPTLSEAFKTAVLEDVAKIFAVEPDTDDHELIIHLLNKIDEYRLLPKYATPEIRG